MKLYKKITLRDIVIIITGAIFGLALSSSTSVSGDAIIGLAGVLIGAIISAIYQEFDSKLGRRNQLRLAAIDKRLEAHQQAYTLWREIIQHVHKKEEIVPIVMKCQKWWNENCLYLSPEARDAFYLAYSHAFNHKDFLEDRINAEIIKQNWKDILGAGEIIVAGVALPTIGEDESKIFKENQNNG